MLYCESYFDANLPNILALCKINLEDIVDSNIFIIKGYLPLIHKDSSTYMHVLRVFVKEGLPLAQEMSLETLGESYMCFQLTLLHSILDAVFTNMDKALSELPLASVFGFSGFDVHFTEWLKQSHGTDQPGEYSFKFLYYLQLHTDC